VIANGVAIVRNTWDNTGQRHFDLLDVRGILGVEK
jgi:hypothetical protein